MLLILAIILCVFASLIYYLKSLHNVWSNRNIPAPQTTFFFGNLLDPVIGKQHFGECVADAYNEFKNCKYVGFYKFLSPAIVIRDPELVGNVLVKDFMHFSDNDIHADENVDYIMSRNLFTMKGRHWKYTKTMLTPMFTSGKLKYIFSNIETVSQQMVTYLKTEIAENRGKCVDGKDLCTKYTTNNVASTAFGLDGKAFDKTSDFVNAVKEFSEQSWFNNLKVGLIFMFPPLQKFIKLKFFKESIEEYLSGIVGETIRYRRENNIVRNDFLDQIYQIKEKSTEFPFTDRDVVANGAAFFVDGVETSAAVMSYVVYLIANYPEVQARLREEFNKISTLTYEALGAVHYLDAVINETLRMYPAGMILIKVCTQEYTLPPVSAKNDTCWTVKPGDSIIIPSYALHKDPQYFPDPEKFMPERFMDENKASVPKNVFMPFGNGPRGCLGMRFALLQLKVGIYALVKNFEITVNPKSLPFTIHPQVLFTAPKNGFWLDFKPL